MGIGDISEFHEEIYISLHCDNIIRWNRYYVSQTQEHQLKVPCPPELAGFGFAQKFGVFCRSVS